MAFPNSTEIQTAAATMGADPIVIFAFAAMHGRLPNPNNGELSQFEAQVTGAVNSWGIPASPAYEYGYIQANGGLPPQGYYFVKWLQDNGYMTVTTGVGAPGVWNSSYPFAGEGYPPGNQPTDPMPTTPGTGGSSTPAPSSGGLFSGLQLDGKTIAIGAAGLGVAWYLFGRHR